MPSEGLGLNDLAESMLFALPGSQRYRTRIRACSWLCSREYVARMLVQTIPDMQQADASYAFGFEIFGSLFASAFSAAPRAEVQHTRVEALIETLTLEVAKMVVRQTTARTQDK